MNIIHAGKDEQGSVEAVVLAFTSLKFYLESFLIKIDGWSGCQFLSSLKDGLMGKM